MKKIQLAVELTDQALSAFDPQIQKDDVDYLVENTIKTSFGIYTWTVQNETLNNSDMNLLVDLHDDLSDDMYAYVDMIRCLEV